MTTETGSDIYGARVSLYNVAFGTSSGANAMKDYAQIVRSRMVADMVVSAVTNYELDARIVQSMLTTSFQESAAIFYITANADDPKLAMEVANAAANAFISQVSIITGQNNVKLLDPADSFNLAYNAQNEMKKTRLIYTGAGFALICIVISLLEIFSTKVSEVGDATLDGEIKLLGVIPRHDI